MNIIFTGGGTGGHLYPAIAVARALKEKDSNNNILFIGNENGIESTIVPKEGFDIKFVKCSSFSSNPIKLATGLCKVATGIFESLSIISKFKPNIIVGSGGYVSAPVTFAGSLKKVPVVLLEQNTISGKTNRFIGKFAKKICISFEDSAESFPKNKTVFTGNPVRDDILSAKGDRLCNFLHILEQTGLPFFFLRFCCGAFAELRVKKKFSFRWRTGCPSVGSLHSWFYWLISFFRQRTEYSCPSFIFTARADWLWGCFSFFPDTGCRNNILKKELPIGKVF